MEKIDETIKRPTIALTGAGGYIGHNLLKPLTEHADVIALSRHVDDRETMKHVEWRSCDFFSMDDAEKGLEGADYAVYLIHSMLPSAKLTQAKFEDMDVILAEHFGRAALKNGVKQIVYLSGILPLDTKKNELSRHLRSRLEVQQILESFGIPVTTIRAGLIVGPKGSSFPILAKLVKRLPIMILPKWTRTQTHPIALSEVLNALKHSIGNENLSGRAIDVGGPEVMTYQEMLKQTAEVMHKKRYFFTVPFFSVMQQQSKSNKQAMKSDVRSVQRMILPEGKDANWAATYYLSWLSSFVKPFIRTMLDDAGNCRVYMLFSRRPLLELTYSHIRSTPSCTVYQITGGSFANTNDGHHGRLEFMQIPGSRECIVAIHDYMPSLPWFVYRFTQAKAHVWVMYAFRKNLLRLIRQHDNPTIT
ncbi:NAD(P)H-binding protein [Paenibacillus agricola]|uniref:NAD(P)H-binding protein n=1 Tax=Paenibacillus agricola TaxID=2716264 RepID=A0ABX0J2Z1_9BACL|nr:NAD(P)H-binding protein [Paenibacillus agricola]NHN30512.1 NAD(P)H-binding protein [Paenibacillus agricola]